MKTGLTEEKMRKFLGSVSSKELISLLWWKFFKHKKLEKLYKNLEAGMSFRFAFENAKKTKR